MNNPTTTHENAVHQFKELIHDVTICMFTTVTDDGELLSRPMATVQIDEEGNAWFFANETSDKVHELYNESSVNLIYSHPARNIYVNVKGTCAVVKDKDKIEAYWTPWLKAWFPDGENDPHLCLIKVTTSEAFYWDSSSNSMVVLFEMLKSVVSGKRYHEGEKGRLDLD